MGRPTRPTSQVESLHYSTSEIRDALAHLADVDWHRLLLAEKFYGRSEDLLQEALVRIVDGRRILPRRYPIIVGVIGVMRSIASERRVNRFVSSDLDAVPDGYSVTSAPSLPADEALISREETEQTQALLKQAFERTPLLGRLWETRISGLSSSEAQRHLGLSDSEYKALDKQLRRLIAKLSAQASES